MSNYLKDCLLCVALFTSFGCVSFHPQLLSPKQKASEFEARRLDNPLLKDFMEKHSGAEMKPWPPEVWGFRLLTLAALYYHPDLDVVRAEWAVAKAGIITAGERPNPSVLLAPEFAAHSQTDISPWLFGVPFDLPIETAGRRGYRVSRAQSLSNASRLKVATTAWSVRARLREALLELRTAEEMGELGRQDLAIRDKIVRLLENRFSLGYISRPVLVQYRISLDHARLSLQQIREQITQDRIRVAGALGVPVSALEGIRLSFDFLKNLPSNPFSSSMRQRALVNRTDILSALSEYEAAQHALQLEIAKQYPDVHLGPGYKYDQGENKWSIGLSIALPVFNRNQGPIAEAEARRKASSDRFAALQAEVLWRIEQANAGYASALKTLEVADNLLEEQEKRKQSVRLQLDSGELDRLALLSAELEVLLIKRSKADAFYRSQQMLGRLENALQCPLTREDDLGLNHLSATNE